MTYIKVVFKDGKFEPTHAVSVLEGTEATISLPSTTEQIEAQRAAWDEFAGSVPPEEADAIDKFVEENFEKIDEELWR